jgi:hypothetical protein
VTYDKATRAAILYVNGASSSSLTGTSLSTSTGIQQSAAIFIAGAGSTNGSAANQEFFDGDITDLRVWNTVRTSSEISAAYKARLQLTATLSGLVVNWPLDRDGAAAFGATTVTDTAAATGANGTMNNGAAYIGILQTFLPPAANTGSFCTTGSNGTVVGLYECAFRKVSPTNQSGDITIPNNLRGVHVKVWGAGGGAYDQGSYTAVGGGGGYSGGFLTSVNTSGGNLAISGQILRVDVGAGGTGSVGVNSGGGGGGASGIWYDAGTAGQVDSATDYAGIIAGGGGGAAFGDDDYVSGGGTDCDVAGDCGPGGGGGGPQNISGLSTVATVRAPDDSSNNCGGRGGDVNHGNGPPQSNQCEGGGIDPDDIAGSDTNGGTNGTGSAGGTSVLGGGGAGNTALSGEIGGGGGGGGGTDRTGPDNANLSDGGGEAGGYDTTASSCVITGTTDSRCSGFGGGGGAGYIYDTGVSAETGIRGSASSPGLTTNDPDYAPSYCSGGTNCVVTPGRGGIVGSSAGSPGLVVISW